MNLKSTSFDDGSIIPTKHGFHHGNLSPQLSFENIPENTKSLVLIMDDPDAIGVVGKVWTHWIVWNIPSNTSHVSENSFPFGSIQGINDFGEIGYGGPAPPDKEHTYYFKLYAIKKILDLAEGASKNDLEKALEQNTIEECRLIGKYSPQ